LTINWNFNLEGKLRNTPIPSNPLMPLFEAIINSFQSINETNDKSNKFIDIYIERDNSQINISDNIKKIPPIINFKIIDNGIGFNNINYESFKTPESLYKSEIGCRGIGRFVWLKAFDDVEIESIFYEGKFYCRKFNFNEKNMTHSVNLLNGSQEPKTIVYLKDFNEKHYKKCPKEPLTIAHRILAHCLVNFLDDNCPKVRLIDDAYNINDGVIILNDVFKNDFYKTLENKIIEIKGESFEIIQLKVFSNEEKNHKISFLADGREIDSVNLGKYIPNFQNKIKEDNRSFVNVYYIKSAYINKIAEAFRGKLTWPEKPEPSIYDSIDDSNKENDDIYEDEVIKKIVEYIKEISSDLIEKINKEKVDKYADFIKNKTISYRYILKHNREALGNLKAGLSEEKLDIELYKIKSNDICKLKEDGHDLLKTTIKNENDYNEYKEKYQKFINYYDDLTKDNLSDYVIHRKLIIDLLENNLAINKDGKYSKEDCVHSIFFPTKTTSDDINYEEHNLWLIDEKLSFHKYLYSDKSFTSMNANEIESDERTDIIIYHNNIFEKPILFSENPEQQYNYSSPISIIEFKRPWRQAYPESENPLKQLYGYAQKIRSGTLLSDNGRPIIKNNNIPIYLYLICDLTPKMKEILDLEPLNLMPDGSGYFGYHPNQRINASIEVLSYDALVDNSRKRNQILFEKLGINSVEKFATYKNTIPIEVAK